MASSSGKALAGDLAWNYASIAVLAASGLAFNLIVAGSYDADALGVFNLAYSVYLLASQLASAGVHMSVLRHCAQGDRTQSRQHLQAGLAASAITAVLVAGAAYGIFAAGGALWPSARWQALNALPPALVFFALNKVALNYLNARGRMRAYAVLQAARFIMIGAALAGLAAGRVPAYALTYCFAIAEAVLAIGTLAVFAARGILTPARPPAQLIRSHLAFGVKIMPANLVLEFNTKIDLIVLSLLTGNDTLVGHYSFASLFVEGFYQVFVVVRRQINPSLARLEHGGTVDRAQFASLRAKLVRWVLPAGLVAAAALVGIYQTIPYLTGDPAFRSATWPLALMLVTIALTTVPVTLGNLLNQTGYPADESKVNVAAAGANLLISLALVRAFGMWGASVAVAASYIVFGVTLRWAASKRLGIKV
ncbi:MAG: polysaccharide biosynthesis C-terminal domain-containing protein [Bifidobacteriaceae bacterium]|jgi:O-antigen/teichoic acid export membrane protein|nr:polysaccharide biosynthesis C-terminal domain-containing protein [Bifidobacteriaceae bacterium]